MHPLYVGQIKMKPILIILLIVTLFGIDFNYSTGGEENFNFSFGNTSEPEDLFPLNGFHILIMGGIIYLLLKNKIHIPTSSKPIGELKRKKINEQLSGVCSGFSDYYNIPVWIPRSIFVLLALTDGIGIAIYIILWIFMPYDEKLISINITESNQSGDRQ
jgi:phage shock protein PspC (stress-responsive transcriptional regulator)